MFRTSKEVVDDEEVNLNVIADDMVYSCRSFFVVLYYISTVSQPPECLLLRIGSRILVFYILKGILIRTIVDNNDESLRMRIRLCRISLTRGRTLGMGFGTTNCGDIY